ncbi:YceI family protein [Marinigracilibium pacificum]|uniref:YceI family protein n=1 Tax=Marinigracilibium pacificum TaxID=2729599 RepID=A0A848JB58_9BACT|nr:YceI family protein [Marinigracilibium pacificum]NMM50262.1 YceI family protein [Marinigracilibium pacificum]
MNIYFLNIEIYFGRIVTYSLLIVLLTFLQSFINPIYGQTYNGAEEGVSPLLDIKLTSNSNLGIFVETNVNSFVCEFQDGDTYAKTLFKGKVYNGTEVFFKDGEIDLPIVKFDCGKFMMNNDFRELLKSEEYPNIQLEFIKAIWYSHKYLNSKHNNGKEIGYFMVNLTVAGKTKKAKVNIYTTEAEEGQLKCSGKIKINMKEFGLEPPVKFMGTVRVKEDIEVRFNLQFIRI